MFQIQSASRSDQGRKRQNNEDFVASFEPDDLEEFQASGCLYIVADGVGGAAVGERASRYAAQKVLYEYYRYPQVDPGERLRQLMRQAGNEIYAYSQDHYTRIATTMVAAVVRENTLTVANVGDSRAYLIRDGRVEQITRDHSLIGEMVRDGVLTEAEALHSKAKNRLTRSLGGEPDVHVDVFADIPLQPGDRILLCSDGLTRYSLPEDLAQSVVQVSPGEAVDRMISYANHRGGADNVSVILVGIDKPANGGPLAPGVSRSWTPEPVDLETMITQPSIEPQRSRHRPLISKRHLPLFMTAVSLVLILVLVGITLSASGVLNREPEWTATIDSGLFSTSVVSEETTEANDATAPPETSPLETSSLLPVQATTPVTTTIETTAPAPENVLETSQPFTPAGAAGEGRTACEYTVVPHDTLGGIYEKLGADLEKLDDVECAPGQNVGCVNPDAPDYPIVDGWVLIIPGSDPTACRDYGRPVDAATVP